MSNHEVVESGDPNDHTYWYNTTNGEIEHGRVSPGLDRIGPFKTKEEAERGPETVRQRAEMWKNEDATDDEW